MSPYAYLNHWFSRPPDGSPAAVSEVIQAFCIVSGIVWLACIRNPVHPAFSSELMRCVGIFVVAYHIIIDVLVFSLDWIFVATGPLENYRRSLAGFLLNLVEIAIFSAIAMLLAGCSPVNSSLWTLVGQQFTDVLQFAVSSGGEGRTCTAIPVVRNVTGGFLLLIVVASLVGGLLRQDRSHEA
jgi:hypothetical protein